MCLGVNDRHKDGDVLGGDVLVVEDVEGLEELLDRGLRGRQRDGGLVFVPRRHLPQRVQVRTDKKKSGG